jgi:hypothetical protein
MVLSFQQKKAKGVLLLQLISTALFATHFGLKGAYTGLALNVISAIRAYVYSQKDKKWASGNLWMYSFIVISIISGVLTWDSPLSLFPMIAMVFTSVGFNAKTAKNIRILTLPNGPLWFIYNTFYAHSAFAAVNDTFCFISALIAILRLDIKKE